MHRLGFVVAPGVPVSNFAALSVFELANAARTFYEVHILSELGGPIRCSVGLAVDTERLEAADFDTVILGAAPEPPRASPRLVAFLREAMSTARRVASLGSGAFLLAEAGLLDGRRATTHWREARALQVRFPNVRMEKDCIFVTDGPIWTSAGGSATIELALGMVEEDLGEEAARTVAKGLVLYHRRTGGQSQHSVLLDLSPKSDRMQNVLTYAKHHLQTPLSVERLAKVANLSTRQFTRAFTRETGRSPAKAIEELRVEAARSLMDRRQHSIEDIARESGFSCREHMRRAFVRAFGKPPQALRRSALATSRSRSANPFRRARRGAD